MDTRTVPLGAKVHFRYAMRPYTGRVVYDRGPIGIGGRHLYGVRYELGPGTWQTTVLPLDEIDTVEPGPSDLPRRRKRVDYILPIEAIEAHTLFARPEHARPLAEFLRSRDVRVEEPPGEYYGVVELIADKSTPWEDFVTLVDEWKWEWAADERTAGARE